MSLNILAVFGYFDVSSISESMISFKAILGFVFTLLVAAVAIVGVLCYNNNNDAQVASAEVRHTHALIHKADEITSAYKDIYNYDTVIFYGNDTIFAERYAAAEETLLTHAKDMVYMLGDNRVQQQRMDSINVLLQRLVVMTDSINAASKSANFIHYTALADTITMRFDSIKQTENRLLASRESAHQQSLARFRNTFALLLIGIVILVAIAFLLVRYNFNKRIYMQDQLRRTNVLFEKVFYESPIAIVISEYESGTILNCNKVFASMVNYDVNDLIGKTAAALGIFESSEARAEILAQAVKKGMARQTEVYIRPRNREPIYISIHAHEIPLYDRKCLLTAIIDLSTHKQAEDDIKRALATEIELNKLKSGFVTLASHEFRTPLTTILSSAFLLENYSFGEHHAKVTKHLHKIKTAVGSLTAILDDFLSVTKIEAGQVEARYQPINIEKCLEDICRNLQPLAKPGQTIYYTHTGDTDVSTDPALLRNIINNLVTNSIKYSPENSPIHVFSLVNSSVHLAVQDEGIGIPEEDQKYLFDRFYRASNAGNVQGTGLGLHIMKRYVEMLHGSVTLESEPGKGTLVQITLERTD